VTALESIVRYLLRAGSSAQTPLIPDGLLDTAEAADDGTTCRALNAAFLILLAGETHPDATRARDRLVRAVVLARTELRFAMIADRYLSRPHVPPSAA
jgi:hypothetical protein